MKIRKSASENLIWGGATPVRCDWCGNPIAGAFFDARLPIGVWGIVCPDCRKNLAIKKGVGSAQEYKQLADGLYHKIP